MLDARTHLNILVTISRHDAAVPFDLLVSLQFKTITYFLELVLDIFPYCSCSSCPFWQRAELCTGLRRSCNCSWSSSPGLTRPGMPRVFGGISTNTPATDLVSAERVFLKQSRYSGNLHTQPLSDKKLQNKEWPLYCLKSSLKEFSTCTCESLLTFLWWDNVDIWYHLFTPLVKLHFINIWTNSRLSIGMSFCEKKDE